MQIKFHTFLMLNGIALLLAACAPPPTVSAAIIQTAIAQTQAAQSNDTTGCVVTISNTLVPLMSEPDTFSVEIIRVPSGEYPILDYIETLFAGHNQVWFQIQVEERTGWIRNDTWTIAAKTNECP